MVSFFFQGQEKRGPEESILFSLCLFISKRASDGIRMVAMGIRNIKSAVDSSRKRPSGGTERERGRERAKEGISLEKTDGDRKVLLFRSFRSFSLFSFAVKLYANGFYYRNTGNHSPSPSKTLKSESGARERRKREDTKRRTKIAANDVEQRRRRR